MSETLRRQGRAAHQPEETDRERMEIHTTDDGCDHHRKLRMGEEVVSRLTVIDLSMRVGSARVRLAGIADVHTAQKHRKRGHMRHLIEDTLVYMRDQGYDVSMLFGISGFYGRFDYAPSLPRYRLQVKTRDVEEASPQAPYTVHPLRADDMPAVLALYNRNNAGRTCTIVRDPCTFEVFPTGSHWGQAVDHFLIEDEQSELAAYAVYDRSRVAMNVTEIESRESRFLPALLRELAKVAVEKRCEELSFLVPPGHAAAEYAQRLGCRWSIGYPKTGDGMMRVMNQGALLGHLLPELESRLRRCPLQTAVELVIQTELGTTGLVIDGASVSVRAVRPEAPTVELSQHQLAQLVVGYRSAHDVLCDAHSALGEETVSALDRLFPRGFPHVWAADCF